MNTLTAEHKSLTFGATIKAVDEAKGIIEGVGNVGVLPDLQGDVLERNCWAKVCAETASGRAPYPAFLWNHNTKDMDVRGKVTYLEEMQPGDRRIAQNRQPGKAQGTATGLFFRAQLAMKTEKGRDAWELISGGYVRNLSVQFNNAKSDEWIDREGLRHVKMVNQLFEISAVLVSASTGSEVLATKAALSAPAWMRSLIADVSEQAEDYAYLRLQAAEDRAYEERYRKPEIAERIDKAAAALLREWEHQREVAAIEKAAGVAGNYWTVQPRPAPRPLTERQKFEQEIAWRAGIY